MTGHQHTRDERQMFGEGAKENEIDMLCVPFFNVHGIWKLWMFLFRSKSTSLHRVQQNLTKFFLALHNCFKCFTKIVRKLVSSFRTMDYGHPTNSEICFWFGRF